MDYYAVLGVPADAGAEAIRRAYRRLARRYHPDAGGSPDKFRQVVEAYATLGNPARRRAYDRARAAPRGDHSGARIQRENAEWIAEMRRWLNTDPFTSGRFRW